MTVASYDQCQRSRSRKRISSRGYDPTLCGVGAGAGNINADLLAAGLRVPYAPTGYSTGKEVLVQRNLFQLCTIGVGSGLWVTGLGQLSMLGVEQGAGGTPGAPPIFPNVIQQDSASFRFADCQPIRWGLRLVRKPYLPWSGQNPLNSLSFAWRWSDNPGLVYEAATFPAGNLDWKGTPDNYLALSSYTSPAAGNVFPGRPVGGDLGCFDSLDFRWQQSERKAFEPIWVDGGGYLVFYAWVDQTNNSTRGVITVPAMFPLPPTGMPENAFIGNWPTTLQYSVGGWIEVEHSEGGKRVEVPRIDPPKVPPGCLTGGMV